MRQFFIEIPHNGSQRYYLLGGLAFVIEAEPIAGDGLSVIAPYEVKWTYPVVRRSSVWMPVSGPARLLTIAEANHLITVASVAAKVKDRSQQGGFS